MIHHIPFALTNPPQKALGMGSISVQFLRYAPKKYMEVPKNWKHFIQDRKEVRESKLLFLALAAIIFVPKQLVEVQIDSYYRILLKQAKPDTGVGRKIPFCENIEYRHFQTWLAMYYHQNERKVF